MQTSESYTREALKAAAVLGLLVALIFGDVIFLGHTLSPALWSWGVLVPPFGYQGRWLQYPTVMDPLATGGQNWPIYELISRTLFSGQLPLWNPYQGTGAPLAADTSWSTYFPVDLMYLVPNQYWDFVWLFKIWLAGIICYLFLRKLGLGHVSATGGSLAYCLSGAFIFYPFLNWTNIAILTPALLLVAKKCFDESSARHTIALGGAVFAISLLGAHIETLVIQFLYVNLFVIFEAITSKREKVRGIATWAGVVLLGLGLASFFLLPVFEYLREAALGHGAGVGLTSLSSYTYNPVIWWVTLFVPYFYGFLQTYPYAGLGQVFFWDISPGYVGTVVFLLSLLPLFSIRRNWIPKRTKYFVFFIIAEILFLMKIFGIPPVNWIGYLPVLASVIFERFSGSVIAMSFAGTCAFGLESVLRAVRRSSIKALLAVLLTIGAAALTTIPFPVSPNQPFFPVSLAYLALSVFYLVLSYCMVSRGGVVAARVLVALVVLELASYVPRSLSVEYEAIRVAILAGAALVLVGSQVKWLRFPRASVPWRRVSLPTFLSRNRAYAMVIIAALVLQFVVAGLSPVGLPNRYDPFTEAPYVRFLQANVGYQRVYSLDGVLFPPYAGVFGIQHLGEFSAFMPASFRNFSLSNLDRGAASSTLSGNAWARNEAYSASSEIDDNLAFYSLLGVKYFVTAYTVLDHAHSATLEPEVEGSHSWAPLGNASVSTSFVTDMSFDVVSVCIGTYDRTNSGNVTLVLDSVPYNATLHRESSIAAESIANGAPNVFTLAYVGVVNKTEFRMTLSQSDTRKGNEVAIMWWAKVKENADLSISRGSLNVALGLILKGRNLPVVYHDQNATIYQNPRAFPRVFLANRLEPVTNEEEAVLKTRDLGWSTREILVIEGASSTQLATVNASGSIVGSAEIERYSPSEVTIRVGASSPSFLVLTDTFYPGWRAYVDGKPETIYRAYGVVRAVFVNMGSHEVIFKYEPDSFRIGSAITFMSALLIILLYLADLRSKFGRKITSRFRMNPNEAASRPA